ncbi:CULLIN-2 domain-containing protein [Favolaschia claudopus]|uniref:CULLIN-2 domain-containing protein n=1 Tax=Favolaschia claudopus TaxID=2862362 RepID=A0AAW0AIV9_9AGAR
MDEAQWKTDLEPVVAEIMTSGGPVVYVAYAAAYAKLYNHLTSRDGEMSGSVEERQDDLYTYTQNFFDEHTKGICLAAPTEDAELVAYYNAEWNRFSNGADAVNRLFTYFNRHYARRTRKDANVAIIRNLAFKSWKNNVFDPLSVRLESVDNQAQMESIRNLLASEDLLVDQWKKMRLDSPASG